jgi:FPC/CPF motif-containing protein YcgG
MTQQPHIEQALNPYETAFSSYSGYRDENLVRLDDSGAPLSTEAFEAHDAFRAHIKDTSFPCIGAKASLNGNFYRYGFYPQITSEDATSGLAHDLWNYAHEQAAFWTNYATFVACFEGPKIVDENEWERLLWGQLQGLHQLDIEHSGWDPTISDDPEDAQFSFSFAGTGFFIVGLHQGASRLARRFAWPTMVFNVHAQFERLREEGLFERMQETIRSRDLKLQGSLNPNLSDFGKQSEAKQYSGRPVEKEWKCPFNRLFGTGMKNPHE